MKLTFVIDVTEGGGVGCRGDLDGMDVYGTTQANLMAVGALEIAKASLLAQRWGLLNNESLVKPETPMPDMGHNVKLSSRPPTET
jgi:hypothetical protein